MIEDLKKLELEAIEAISNVQTEHNLNEVKASYLGKKSKLQEIMSKMKGQEDEQRATNELNELSTAEHKGQGESSTRESLTDNRPIKNKNKE